MDIRLEGVLDDGGGLRVVTSEPFAAGVHPATSEERRNFFEGWGYFQIDDQVFYDPDSGEVISDASGKNVLIDEEGDLFPIDVHFRPVSSRNEETYDNTVRARLRMRELGDG